MTGPHFQGVPKTLVDSTRPLHMGTKWRNFSHETRVVILSKEFTIRAFFPAFKAQYLHFSISTMYIYVNFMFSGREKFSSCYENVKFISSRHHVISSMYLNVQKYIVFVFAFALGSLNPLFDDGEFRSRHVQRAFQYLTLWESAKENLVPFLVCTWSFCRSFPNVFH